MVSAAVVFPPPTPPRNTVWAADVDLIVAGIVVVACCLFTFVAVNVAVAAVDDDNLLKSLVGECKPSGRRKR